MPYVLSTSYIKPGKTQSLREIIESVQAKGYHPRLEVDMPESVRAFQLENAPEAFDGAEIVLLRGGEPHGQQQTADGHPLTEFEKSFHIV